MLTGCRIRAQIAGDRAAGRDSSPGEIALRRALPGGACYLSHTVRCAHTPLFQVARTLWIPSSTTASPPPKHQEITWHAANTIRELCLDSQSYREEVAQLGAAKMLTFLLEAGLDQVRVVPPRIAQQFSVSASCRCVCSTRTPCRPADAPHPAPHHAPTNALCAGLWRRHPGFLFEPPRSLLDPPSLLPCPFPRLAAPQQSAPSSLSRSLIA